MKQILRRVLALTLAAVLLLPLSACGEAEAPNALLIYMEEGNPTFGIALELFEEKYPDVEVTVEKVGYDDYGERLATDLMSGGGPDVLMISKRTFLDIYKALDQGTFLDLTPMIEADEDFAQEKLVQPVMDVGKYKGKQYFIPYQYTTGTLLTEKGVLAELGLEDLPETTDFTQFWEKLFAVQQQMSDQHAGFRSLVGNFSLEFLLSTSGVSLIDRETKTILPDENELQELTEVYKKAYQTNAFGDSTITYLYGEISDALQAGSCVLVENPNTNVGAYVSAQAFVKSIGDAVAFPLPTLAGGATGEVLFGIGINSAAQNPELAWNFLKIYLSDEVLNAFADSGGTLCVKRDVMDQYIEKEYWSQWVENASTISEVQNTISEEEMKAYLEQVTDLSRCTFYEQELWNIYQECMQPYFEDTGSYENCVNALRERLTIYVTE